MKEDSREAWERLYAKHGIQFGGSGDLGPLERLLRNDMLILDAGCGEGKTTEVLLRKAEAVGCDFSRKGLLALRSRVDHERRLNLVECDLAVLPFAQEKFDAIICVHSLSHLLCQGREMAATGLTSSLKKGGYILVEGFGRGDLRFGEGKEVEEASFLRGNGITTHYFAQGEIPRLFARLTPLSEAAYTRRIAYGTRAGVREVVRAIMQRPN